jgi:uncharacterized membrane protein (DUF485 family)
MPTGFSTGAGDVIPGGRAEPEGTEPGRTPRDGAGRGQQPSQGGPAATGEYMALPRYRRSLAWTLTIAGLAAYNWWLLVPFKPGLMTSPNELFSNLEVSGQPYAAAMQHADLLAGLLLLAAFAIAGPATIAGGRRDWLAMLTFAVAGAAGGLFPEVCEDGVSAVCRQQEIHFQLPAGQYIHMVAGIFEFAAITAALVFAIRRARPGSGRTARIYRSLAIGALICYPLLGLAYLLDRMGGVMEAVFFIGFTVMVLTWITERTRRQPGRPPAPARRELADCGRC